MTDLAAQIPYPIASIVDTEHGRYIVAQLSYENCGRQPASYSLRGHPELGTTPSTHAWYAHADLTMERQPDADTWSMLKDAVALDQQSRTIPTHG